MKTIYFMSRNNEYLDKAVEYLNFACVLVEYGMFPEKSLVWMRWGKGTENDTIYKKLNEKFALEAKGISLTQGTFFKEDWLWTDDFENIVIVGEPELLLTDIKSLYVFAAEGTAPEQLPEGFLYKMESEVVDNRLKVLSRGFIYHSEKDGK